MAVEIAAPLRLLYDSHHFPGAKENMYEAKQQLYDYRSCQALL